MKLQRILRFAPLALLFASVASAQTTGNIIGVVTDAQSGKPIVGALVIATSPSSQGEQTAVTDKSGGFRFQLLTPGDYKLATSFDGYKAAERSDLTVRVDKTIRANLSMVPEAVQMEEQVVRTGVAPVINVGSAESGTVVSREFLSNVPGTRGFEGIAVTAPTAQLDQYGISFAGASSPENGYLLDGMNIGDAGYGSLSGEILNNFVQEIDIKTGNFMPEYGFSTGGVVSVVTKSGSNEFHGSVFANLNPGALRADGKAIGRDAEALSRKLLPKDGTWQADFGFEVGGPILKDRLWFYAGFAPRLTRNTYERFASATQYDDASGSVIRDGDGLALGTVIPGSQKKYTNKTNEYQAVGKLTYLFNENNQLAVSLFYVPSTTKGYGGANAALSAAAQDLQDDFTDVVARYTSKLLDKKLQLELTGGYHGQTKANNPVTTDGIDGEKTATVQWARTHDLQDFETAGTDPLCAIRADGFNPCTVFNYVSGGSGYIDETTIKRFAGKAALTYFAEAAGNHQIKGGIDVQRSNYDHSKAYSGPNNASLPGGAWIIERAVAAGAAGTNPAVNNTTFNPTGIWFQDFRRYGLVAPDRLSAADAPGGRLTVGSLSTITAYYLQDSYSPSFLEGLTLNLGVRWETQSMSVPDQEGTGFSINDSVGPRIQAVYDWTKQGRSKVAASYGRFYASFPLDMADRAFGNETQIRAYRPECAAVIAALDPAANKNTLAGAPESCAVAEGFFRSNTFGNYTYAPYSPGIVPVAPDIKSPYVDMFGGSVEYELFSDFSMVFEYQGRRQGPVIEDMSPDDFVHAAIANPGTGKPFDDGTGFIFDPTVATSTDAVTGRTFNVAFPKPKRDYDGFTLLAKKNFSKNWQAQVSYTYSSLRGNYPGFFRPETGQFDPGINSTYDLASLLANGSGPLPGDMPHSFKAYGSYAFDFGPKLQAVAGGALRLTSGTPVNYLIAHVDYGSGEGYGLPRGSAGRTPAITNFDLKGILSYTITPPYQVKFSVDVFNVLNAQNATTVDENWTFDATLPIIGGQCSSKNAASKSNPVTAALADCPSLNYMKTTDGLEATINPNFAKPTAYQTPLSVRFGLEMTF